MSQRNATLFRRASKLFGVDVKHIKATWKDFTDTQKFYMRSRVNTEHEKQRQKRLSDE